MGEFLGWMFALAVVICMTVANTTFRFDANETVKMLNEVCIKNRGIRFSKIDVDNWRFTCNDGASFVVDRKAK